MQEQLSTATREVTVIAEPARRAINIVTRDVPWGAFPSHTLDDVQSGIGFVPDTFMLDAADRC